MKKNEEYDFSIPRRQSFAAIILIAYKLYKVLLRQLFPFLLIFLFGGGSNKKNYLIIMVCILASIGFIYSIVAFFKYYFFVKGNKLVVKEGVFKKSIIEIPFDRIQSINFEQNVLHRLFNVVRLNMDTAGSSTSELQLNSLDHGMATQLSDFILKHKSDAQNSDLDSGVQKDFRSTKEVIFSLSITQLLKVGLTANHFRSGLIIIFFFVWIWENLQEIGMDIRQKVEENIPQATEVILGSLVVLTVLTILFGITALLISMVRTVLKFYKLNMFRISDGFVIESGLLNRREYAAKDNKIQLFSWSQNLLQSFINIFELKLKQASSIQVSDRKSLQLAGLNKEDVSSAREYLFKAHDEELRSMSLRSVNPYYRFRRIYYTSLIFVPLLLICIWANRLDLVIFLGPWYLISLYGAQLNYTKKKFGFSDNLFKLEGGTFGSKATVLLLSKVQNISILSTPFQRRRKLGSLVVYTASGSIKVPDIDDQLCQELNDMLLYKVESSGEDWM